MIAEGVKWAALAADSVGIAVILLGFVTAVARFIPTLWASNRNDAIVKIQMIRCDFGTYLVFALELMIVSDLLHSVLSRELEDLYIVAVIVGIRTMIGYFLNQEIQELSGVHHD